VLRQCCSVGYSAIARALVEARTFCLPALVPLPHFPFFVFPRVFVQQYFNMAFFKELLQNNIHSQRA
jgi:hypothetical protein